MINGHCALLFSNSTPEEVESAFAAYRPSDFARSGSLATDTVVLPKGESFVNRFHVSALLTAGTDALASLPHSIEAHLRQLGLPTVLKEAKIHLLGDHTVCTAGKDMGDRIQELSADAAQARCREQRADLNSAESVQRPAGLRPPGACSMFCPLGNTASQRLRRVQVSLLHRQHMQGPSGHEPWVQRQILIPARGYTRAGPSPSINAEQAQKRPVIELQGMQRGHSMKVAPGHSAKCFAPNTSPSRSPQRFDATPRTASPVSRREVQSSTSSTTRAGEISTMYVARVGRSRADLVVERSRSCSDVCRGGNTSQPQRSNEAGKAGEAAARSSGSQKEKEKIQPRGQLTETRQADF
eukprot:s2704_g1.t1